jgi:iron complex outermembrane recepter protein
MAKLGLKRLGWVLLGGMVLASVTLPGTAQESAPPILEEDIGGSKPIEQPPISDVQDIQQPAITVKEWRAQIEAATVKVTRVKLEQTETGLDIILKTAEGKPLQVDASQFRTSGHSLIAEIPNAVLALPEGQEFVAENPTADILSVQVVQQKGDTIWVMVTGKEALPQTEVMLKTGDLTYGLNPVEEEEETEITVTAEREEEETGYRVPNTSVGTRTDTPLRDIPASIQVVPKQVLEEQQVDNLNEALKNVPGLIQNTPDDTPIFQSPNIRGFFTGEGNNFTRNGLNLQVAGPGTAIFSNIEQVEVLRGPASVLFGRGNPGGTINIVTKQPQSDPFYSVEASVGSYDFYQGAVDLTGPLNDSKTIQYRLNASYENAGSFVDFVERETPAVAGALKFKIGENTDLTFDTQYVRATVGRGSGLPLEGTLLPNPNGEIPLNRNLSNPDGFFFSNTLLVGYNLEHRFSENWTVRNAFYFSNEDYGYKNLYEAVSLDPDLRTLQRETYGDYDQKVQAFDLVTNVVGKFSTGPIQHQLLLGADLRRSNFRGVQKASFRGTPIDLFNPVYSAEILDEQTFPPSNTTALTNSLGIYIQDQITVTDNLKFLLGGRFDTFEQTDKDLLANTETSQSGSAFSPRLGIVYQPIEPISLYASYSRSFTPTIGRSADNEPFKPGRGTQYEIGVKADINDKLSTTLAFYDLTRTNVTTADPDRPGFEIQTGEQNSRGVELFVSGEILPGWNVIAGYAYTNARLTKDNAFPVGNQINNVAKNSLNFWTSYEIQKGTLKGLGFGLGFFYTGDRQGDLDNSFALPSYLRTDAAIFYKRDRFRVGLNFTNLFDIEYFQPSNAAFPVYPGEPFTVQGTVSWEF